jgi:repressor LexA
LKNISNTENQIIFTEARPMKGLTDKQRFILDYIEEFQEREAMSPTVYEIADRLGIKNTTVFAHLRALQKKNYLARTSKARSIRLLKPRHALKNKSPLIPVPVLSRITPELLEEDQKKQREKIYCSALAFHSYEKEKVFAVKVNDVGMQNLGILKGDLVIAYQTEKIKLGSVVVASIDGEATVRSYHPFSDTDMIELRPANFSFKTEIYHSDSVYIAGKLIGLERIYRGKIF